MKSRVSWARTRASWIGGSVRARALRHWRRAVVIGLLLGLVPLLVLVTGAAFTELPPELLLRSSAQSIRVEDRDGKLLREVRTSGGSLARWVPLSAMPPELPLALVAIEDHRFFRHPGVDPVSIFRAAGQALWHRRVISGASTISMQLARRLRPHPRTLWGKWGEMALALRIEFSLSKERILEEYLNRVDYGPNLQGVATAAQCYFGKPVSSLSLGEIALLVGLPQGPSAYALGRRPERALARRNRVLTAMVAQGQVSPAEAEAAGHEPLKVDRRRSVFGAPHFVAALLGGGLSKAQPGLAAALSGDLGRIRTTLDSPLQRAAENAVTHSLANLRSHQVNAGAALVVDNASGEILAYVGSPDFYDENHSGQVDGVRALRQPGSTLKPFVYAAAFDELGYTPATVIPDLELRIPTPEGLYTPRNYDDRFRGPVRLREALGNSLNVPAVHTAAALRPATLLRRLHALGFDSLQQKPEFYGPALALGDGEVTLLELVRAYATLARGGRGLSLRSVSEVEKLGSVPMKLEAEATMAGADSFGTVLSPATAALITDILKDKSARAATFGLDSPLEFEFEVAAKTGTSKGYRDNWVVGYTSQITVGVWVGNFDGAPMREVGGITGAAPIFHAILEASWSRAPLSPLAVNSGGGTQSGEALGLQRVEICPISGEARGAHCPRGLFEWISGRDHLASCSWHQEVEVDSQTGKRVGQPCSRRTVVRRTFTFFPPEYGAWARSTGQPPPPDEYLPDCPASTEVALTNSSESLQITAPKNGARYAIDADRPLALQTLEVTVVAASGSRVALEVDGRRFDERSSPFTFDWPLQPGHHRLVAVASQGKQSPPVEIDVR